MSRAGAMELWKLSRGNDGNANGFSDTVKHTVEAWSSNQILQLTMDMQKKWFMLKDMSNSYHPAYTWYIHICFIIRYISSTVNTKPCVREYLILLEAPFIWLIIHTF
jgi:hypothetical protein